MPTATDNAAPRRGTHTVAERSTPGPHRVTASRAQPEHPRLLGRSRDYTPDTLPARLRHWHAPRINRWERLCVTTGTLAIECLGAGGATGSVLAAGEQTWFAPGTRWRVAHLDADGRFEIEVHADSRGQAEAPQPVRSDLLSRARRVQVPDVAALLALARALAPGERRLVDARFSLDALPAVWLRPRTLFWHPLHADAAAFTTLIAHSSEPIDLATYLGRDHAVIEAALGEALSGDAEGARWLRAALERHLHIEEALVFPAYLDVGGDERLVRGLENEHRYLRQYLRELDQPASRRKFLRLLDGHDEKEECVVYPDVIAKLGVRADPLLDRAITRPPPFSD
ncbi:MAG: hemerythrin domain-containing protein [Rhodanobacteraceae bacterium]